MQEITVTMEKVTRVSKTFTVSDEEYNDILTDGICPKRKEMEQALADVDAGIQKGDIEYDYSITDDRDRVLIPWA